MTNKLSILVINGPNINLLGQREPDVYGSETLSDINQQLAQQAETLGVELSHFQSNHEGAIVDRIQAAFGNCDFILINPAAYTHTSVAIRDALAGVAIPYIEVHLSNIHARESFRQHSFMSEKAQGVICGLGSLGYQLALTAAHQQLQQV